MEEAARKFVRLVYVYEILSDPVRRRDYDANGDPSGGSSSAPPAGGRPIRDYAAELFDLYVRFQRGSFEMHYTRPPKRSRDRTRDAAERWSALNTHPTASPVAAAHTKAPRISWCTCATSTGTRG